MSRKLPRRSKVSTALFFGLPCYRLGPAAPSRHSHHRLPAHRGAPRRLQGDFRLLIQGPDFNQEQTVKEIGRNQLHTATELSFKIGCLATANGSCISATLSSICGIPDRGKRDRSATAYVLEVDKCTEHLLLNRCFQQIDQRSQVLTIDAPALPVPPKETPIGLWDFGLAAVPDYLLTGKYPANQLLRKNIHGLPPPPPQEDEDEDEDEDEGAA